MWRRPKEERIEGSNPRIKTKVPYKCFNTGLVIFDKVIFDMKRAREYSKVSLSRFVESYLIANTGQWALLITELATPPIMNFSTPVKPLVPITITSASDSLA